MIKMKESLSALLSDIECMSSAASEGTLGNRLQADRHNGSYKDLVMGCNNTLDAMHTPIEESALILSKMANGDFTVRMNGNYKGDFIKLQNSINKVAESMRDALSKISRAIQLTSNAGNEISSSTEEMSAGSQEQSMQAAEIAGAVEEMTKTILETTQNASRAAEYAERSKKSTTEGVRKIEITKISKL